MAQIPINLQDWGSLGKQGQEELIRILKSEGLLRPEDELYPSEETMSALAPEFIENMMNTTDNEACKQACKAAYDNRVIQCNKLSPIGQPGFPAPRGMCLIVASITFINCMKGCTP